MMNSFLRVLLFGALLLWASNLPGSLCMAQQFNGEGDGFSWNDDDNWNGGVPQPDSGGGNIGRTPDEFGRYHVFINSSATPRNISVSGFGDEDHAARDPFLTINAPTSVSNTFDVYAGDVNINSDLTISNFPQHQNDFGFLNINGPSTINLNSGTVTANSLVIANVTSESYPQINQNGGNLDILSLEMWQTALALGPNDTLSSWGFVGENGTLTIGGPQTIHQTVSNGGDGYLTVTDGTLNVNADLELTPLPGATIQTFVGFYDASTLNLNSGTITVEQLHFYGEPTIHRAGGQIQVDELLLENAGNFTIQSNDVVAENLFIDDATNLVIEQPLSLRSLVVSNGAAMSYSQPLGASNGITVGEGGSFVFSVDDGQVNLAFDSEEVDGLDWILRVYGSSQLTELQSALASGAITTSGELRPVSVIYNPALFGDYTYIGYVVTEETTPATADVTSGQYVSGGLTELESSDNSDFVARRSPSDVLSRVIIDVDSTSPTESPTGIAFTVEASVFARTQVIQRIELFDFDAGVFELVDTRDATRFSDSTATVTATGDLSRYVEDGTGKIRARVKFRSPNNRQQFTANVDQMSWSIF